MQLSWKRFDKYIMKMDEVHFLGEGYVPRLSNILSYWVKLKGHMIHFMDHLALSVQDFWGSHNYKRDRGDDFGTFSYESLTCSLGMDSSEIKCESHFLSYSYWHGPELCLSVIDIFHSNFELFTCKNTIDTPLPTRQTTWIPRVIREFFNQNICEFSATSPRVICKLTIQFWLSMQTFTWWKQK